MLVTGRNYCSRDCCRTPRSQRAQGEEGAAQDGSHPQHRNAPPGTSRALHICPDVGKSSSVCVPGASCDSSGFCCPWSSIPTLCLKSLLKVPWPSLGLSAFFFLAPLEGDSAAAFGPGCPPGPFSALEPLCTTAGAGECLLQVFALSKTLFHHNTHRMKGKYSLLALDKLWGFFLSGFSALLRVSFT